MFYTIFDFPMGSIFLAKSDKGLNIAHYVKTAGQIEKVMAWLEKKSIPLVEDKKKFRKEEELFSQYFKGKEVDFTSLPLDFFSATPYQKKVWLETRKIPHGKTETYKSLAHKLSHRGYRSVGQALSKNPLLIIIPCHRVIGSDGSLRGFGAGLEVKDFLLRLERGEHSA